MAETVDRTYKVKTDNTADTTPNSVAVINDGTGDRQIVVLGAGDGTTTINDGTPAHPINTVSVNGELADTTGTFTNATQTTSITASGLDGYANTLVSINGTYGTATAVFEGSDDSGTTWYPVVSARDNTNVIELGYTSLTNINQTWQINNGGFDSIRVRSTAVASGTVNVRLSPSSEPTASGATVGIGTPLPAGTNLIGSTIAAQTDTFGSTTTLTITLASLANSTAGVGRQSTLITGNTARSAIIACKITTGTTPTANSLFYVYLIRGDATLNDDGAGSTDAGLTVINAPLLGTILVPAATSNTAYTALFDTKPLGSLSKTFGIAVVNSSGVALNATAGNHSIEYTLMT